tara:strand:+ start:5496 stop:5879 length:384 start_codon:yes stop_codon:yes gene_type:complete
MARWTYAFSNGLYNDWHRKYDHLAGIDIDFIEVCPNCYEPLAILETCYDKGQKYKATTLVKTLSDRLRVPSFLVFYKNIGQGSLAFRIKRLHLPNSDYEIMSEDEWVNELYDIQYQHKEFCPDEAKI